MKEISIVTETEVVQYVKFNNGSKVPLSKFIADLMDIADSQTEVTQFVKKNKTDLGEYSFLRDKFSEYIESTQETDILCTINWVKKEKDTVWQVIFELEDELEVDE